MVGMTLLKKSVLCLAASLICYAIAIARGDGACAGYITATLILGFFAFALAALALLILGLAKRKS
jgi:hypothetical protein